MTRFERGLSDSIEKIDIAGWSSGCDYCDERVPLLDGWHYIVDPEDFEGTQKVACAKRWQENILPPDEVLG